MSFYWAVSVSGEESADMTRDNEREPNTGLT